MKKLIFLFFLSNLCCNLEKIYQDTLEIKVALQQNLEHVLKQIADEEFRLENYIKETKEVLKTMFNNFFYMSDKLLDKEKQEKKEEVLELKERIRLQAEEIDKKRFKIGKTKLYKSIIKRLNELKEMLEKIKNDIAKADKLLASIILMKNRNG